MTVHNLAFATGLACVLAMVGATAAIAQTRKGSFTPACAARDLRALDALDEFGAIDEMPTAWLVSAGFSFLQARVHCLAGEQAEGLALYDRIIAGDARLSHAEMSEVTR
jgi:hypothetical protein